MAKLDQALSYFHDRVSDCIKSGKNISVITHLDCDGITSGSIVTKSLIRAGAKCTVRTVNEFSKNILEKMKTDSRQFHIITDLGGGFAKDIDNALGEDWIVVDHHQIPQEEFDNQKVINAWKFDVDGGKDVSAGGMAYLVSKATTQREYRFSMDCSRCSIRGQTRPGREKIFYRTEFGDCSYCKKEQSSRN